MKPNTESFLQSIFQGEYREFESFARLFLENIKETYSEDQFEVFLEVVMKAEDETFKEWRKRELADLKIL